MLKRKTFRYTIDEPGILNHISNDRDMIWESKNGTKTRLKDMDFNHLKHAYAKLKRGEYDHWILDFSIIEALKMELRYRELLILNTDKDE